MKITASGIPVGGVAEAGVWVGATKIKSGGTATVGGDRVYYQGFSDARMHSCKLDGSDDVIPDCPSGIALIVASSTVWAAWTAGSVTATSWGEKFPNAVPMAATEDGAILLLTSYNTGKGLRMVDKDGEVWSAFYASPQVQYPYPQAFALDRDRVVYLDVGEGRFNSWGLPDPKQVLGVSAFDPFLIEHDGEVWLGYHTSDGRALLHPIDDASKGYVLAEGETFGTTATGDWFGYSRDQGESQMVVAPVDWSQPLVELKAIQPPPPPPPKPDHFGPVSEASPDGYEIDDLSEFIVGDATKFPRIGTHPVTQHIDSRGHIFWGKFYNGTSFKDKGRYEEYAIGQDYVHLIADVSNNLLTSTTDTRWLPRKCKVGLAHLFRLPPHELIDRDRNTGEILNTQGWARDMGVIQHWNEFDFGPDLGIHEAVCILHDNTGGAWAHDRGQELYIYGRNIGCVRWSYYRTDRSMPGYVFNDWSLKRNEDGSLMQSDFYTLGGVPWVPDISPIQLPMSPEVPSMQMPSDVLATIKQFAGKFPLPQGGNEVVMHDWSRRAAEQVKFTHDAPGIEYGLKSTSPGSPTSNNLARRDAQGIHTWDYIQGSAGPTPQLQGDGGEYFFIPMQHFIPVTAVNHLGDQKPRPGRAPWPAAVRYGVSGFDVAPRLHGGDLSYYNLTAPLPLNCFVYTTIIHPETHRLGRTFAQGLVQTETLLKRLTADNRQAMFIMICGPHTANNGPKPTRAEILDMVKQQVALFVRYPKAVLALSLGNELYQGFEPPELLDPTLWAEVDQLVPLEFPFCVGQVSESVVFGPGSFAAMHPDRGKSSADALQILADAQAHDGRTVVAREPKRIEAGNFAPTEQASGDLNFVKEELANAKRLGLPYFLHLAAGRGCHVPAMDDVQHQALALIKAEAAAVTPPGPPVPPITPPGSGHPILDCNLSEGAGPNHFSHKGYELFVLNKPALVAEAHAWFIRGKGVPMPPEQESFFVDIRCNRECHVWVTPRRAWTDALPGGAP